MFKLFTLPYFIKGHTADRRFLKNYTLLGALYLVIILDFIFDINVNRFLYILKIKISQIFLYLLKNYQIFYKKILIFACFFKFWNRQTTPRAMWGPAIYLIQDSCVLNQQKGFIFNRKVLYIVFFFLSLPLIVTNVVYHYEWINEIIQKFSFFSDFWFLILDYRLQCKN